MKNIMKIALVALTAFSFSVANAGELSITGDAKASYSITSSDGGAGALQRGKGLGVSNEFTLGASGELDNGWSWSYAQDIDGATAQDDGKLTVTMGSLGTAGVFISEGGLDVDNTASQSVMSRPSDTSFNEGMFDTFDLSGMNTLQYHMPADLLPFGIVGKVAYAPSSSSAASINSYKATGAANNGEFTESSDVGNTATNPFAQTSAMGKSATHYQLKAAPIDGLELGADYVDYKGVHKASGTMSQNPESGSYYATYAVGPATIGYSKSYTAFAIGAYNQDNTESVEGTKYSIAVNVNDDLSVSYENEESNPDNQTAATSNFSLEATGIQAAYTMGGMTLAIAMNDYENANYTENKDIKDTVFSVAMAF
jgi:hypothetical protein